MKSFANWLYWTPKLWKLPCHWLGCAWGHPAFFQPLDWGTPPSPSRSMIQIVRSCRRCKTAEITYATLVHGSPYEGAI